MAGGGGLMLAGSHVAMMRVATGQDLPLCRQQGSRVTLIPVREEEELFRRAIVFGRVHPVVCWFGL